MTWRAAFIAQAQHEYAIFRQLNEQGAAIADQLHYLQMATEKLARGYLAGPADSTPPEMTHAGIIRMLQHLKADRRMRRRLGILHLPSFRSYLDSLVETASRIQSLAPAIAGDTQPNPEYPWLDKQSNIIRVPYQFGFQELSEFKNARASKFLKLLNRLMIVVEP